MLRDVPTCEAVEEVATEACPAEAQMVISALEAGAAEPGVERRTAARMQYRVRATLRLFNDPSGSAPWLLYSRDACVRGLGFVTPHRLPLGYGGIVELIAPDGSLISAQCTVNRCREAGAGWFEGALHFNRNQFQLAPPVLEE